VDVLADAALVEQLVELLVTDPHACLPAFQQLLAALVARALNALHGRKENLWGSGSYGAVTLATPADVVAKAAYTLANPVAAGLVRHGREWPGLWSSPSTIGTTLQMPRPAHFFSEKGHLPATVDLQLSPPPGFATPQAFREALEQALASQEGAAARERRRFLGRKRVLAERPFDHPATEAPKRALNPRVAARDKWKRRELLGLLKAFLADYRDALLAWREGRRKTTFPAGTYLMRVAHGVACAGAS